jgi:hypothetical protein
MYFIIPDFIRIVNYNDTAICLNLIEDKYFLFNHSCARMLNAALTNQISYDANNVSPFLQSLLTENILQLSKMPQLFNPNVNLSIGVENLDWDFDKQSFEVEVPIKLSIECLITLHKVRSIVKRKPQFLVEHLKTLSLKNDFYHPDELELNLLSAALNKATLIYPGKTKCYEWAIAYELMALKRRWQCNINLGVQNYPFRSHAWITCKRRPVSDHSMLDKLSIILSEPFSEVE